MYANNKYMLVSGMLMTCIVLHRYIFIVVGGTDDLRGTREGLSLAAARGAEYTLTQPRAAPARAACATVSTSKYITCQLCVVTQGVPILII